MLSQFGGSGNVLLFFECFLFYSFAGWVVESIYMSLCNKKITNRGFAKGPLCPIYGFGGTLGYFLLHSLNDRVILLYIVSAILATMFEFLVGKLMIYTLGDLWWDYDDKPFNYKGIICLESTIAWGFYGVFIVRYINDFIVAIVSMIPRRVGIVVCTVCLTGYLIDFVYHLLLALDMTPAECKDKIVENVRDIRARRG